MSDMEEAEVYLQAKKEAESAKMDNVDLSTLVESLTAKLAEQTKIAQKAKDVTDEALANVRALEGDMAYMDYAPEHLERDEGCQADGKCGRASD